MLLFLIKSGTILELSILKNREKEYNKLAGYEDENFCNLNSGYYDFGNYSIQIIEKQSIVEL